MNLPAPRAILFDWDGTIVDSMARVSVVLRAVGQEMGLPPINDQQVHDFTIYAADSGRIVFGLDDSRATQLDRLFREKYVASTGACGTMPGMADFIAALPEQLPVGIVTNGWRELVEAQLRYLGWQDRFQSVVCVNEAPRNKPHPDPALLALEKLDQAPGCDIWFIGDTRGDIMCAQAAGLTAIYLGIPHQCAPDFTCADGLALHQAYRNIHAA